MKTPVTLDEFYVVPENPLRRVNVEVFDDVDVKLSRG